MSLYLKFLSYSSDANLDIDHTAHKLLEIIAVCAQHEPLTVTEAMELTEIASPATVHRKLNQLIAKQLITAVYDGQNRRTKYLVLMPKAISYFHKLSESMKTCVLEAQT